MRSVKSQAGFLLIVAVVLIMIVALMATAMLTLTAGSGQAGASHLGSTQALFAAESGMERALRGLSREGATCANLTYNGTLAVGGGSATFATTGTVNAPTSTTLSANINATTAVIPVASITNYASHGRVTIGAETIQYQSTSTSAAACVTAPCFLGAVRGVGGTPAATHNNGDVVRQLQCTIRSTGASGSAQRVVERAATISAGTGAMMAYAREDALGVPRYRLWNNATSTWGAEQNATSVGAGRVVQYIVLKAARTRNEVIMGTLDSTGDIRVQVWNGTAWGATTLIQNVTGTHDDFRGFDIEYETNTDRAVLVFQTTAVDQFSYRTWNGTAWSAATAVALTAGCNRPRWIQLARNPEPASNEIVLITLSDGSDVCGMRWTGAAWSNMGVAAVWDGGADSATRNVTSVAYEQRSSPARALFAWGTGTTTQNFRTWNGAALSGITAFTLAGASGAINWARLAPNPFSNEMLYGAQDASRDLNTAYWNGVGPWVDQGQHDGGLENAASRNFDLIFDPSPNRAGNAWLIWGSRTGTDLTRRRQYTGGAWSATITNFGDDTALLQLVGQPNSGWIFGGLYGDSTGTQRDIVESHYNGAWAETTVWNGGVIADPVHERVEITPITFGLGIYDWVEVFP